MEWQMRKALPGVENPGGPCHCQDSDPTAPIQPANETKESFDHAGLPRKFRIQLNVNMSEKHITNITSQIPHPHSNPLSSRDPPHTTGPDIPGISPRGTPSLIGISVWIRWYGLP